MSAVGILLLSFVVGSFPTSNLLARFSRGVDLRDVGGGTISGTALYRVAGFVPLALGGILDIAKGTVGPLLAGTDRPVLAAFAGAAAVVGHNWSLFLKGAGGRGIAPAIGALLVNAWPGAVLVLAGPMVGRWCGQTGLGGFVGELALTPVLAVTHGRNGAIAGVVIAVPMLLKRVLGNSMPRAHRGRVYLHRLLFDHDPVPGAP